MGNSHRTPNGSYLKGIRYAALRPDLLNIVPFVVVGSCENASERGGTTESGVVQITHFVDSISFPRCISLISANSEYECPNSFAVNQNLERNMYSVHSSPENMNDVSGPLCL